MRLACINFPIAIVGFIQKIDSARFFYEILKVEIFEKKVKCDDDNSCSWIEKYSITKYCSQNDFIELVGLCTKYMTDMLNYSIIFLV